PLGLPPDLPLGSPPGLPLGLSSSRMQALLAEPYGRDVITAITHRHSTRTNGLIKKETAAARAVLHRRQLAHSRHRQVSRANPYSRNLLIMRFVIIIKNKGAVWM